MKMNRLLAAALAGGVLLGFVGSTLVRLAMQTDQSVHYHANFALFIEGTQEMFEGPGYYEEVQACSDDHNDNPRGRVHMHGKEAGLIHVHDDAVTWGNFFENIGYGFADGALVLPDGTVLASDKAAGTSLTYILNGEPVTVLANTRIVSEDKLLITYGNESVDAMQKQFAQIPATAAAANGAEDPATCRGAVPKSFWQRVKMALGAS